MRVGQSSLVYAVPVLSVCKNQALPFSLWTCYTHMPLFLTCCHCACRDAEEVAARLGGIPPDLPSRGGLALLQVRSKP